MKRFILLVVVALCITTTPVLFSEKAIAASLTDAQIKRTLIAQSIASYPGNCPCPYNFARNGSRCGLRSAYSRPGGFSPICFEGDVSAAMIEQYRQVHR